MGAEFESGTAADANPGVAYSSVPKAKRERSTIEFPYSDLSVCVELARVLHVRAGGKCDDTQLAAWLDQTATGGGFRSRLSASRLFGLIEIDDLKQISITKLGRDALDDSPRVVAARAEAFLRVPLFKVMYEKHGGHGLPPAAAIERLMEGYGVGSKLTDRARQTFLKSAAFAQFIDGQNGRFIKPGQTTKSAPPVSESSDPPRNGGAGGGDPPSMHPFIKGLLETLPTPKTEWAVADRADWLQTAASIFKLIYKGGGSIEIRTVEPRNDNGSQT